MCTLQCSGRQLARAGPISRWKLKKANAHNTLKANIGHTKLSSNHKNLHIPTGKSMTLLPTCNWHIEAEEASSGRAQHFRKAGSSSIALSSLNLDSQSNTPSQTSEGHFHSAPAKKKTNARGYFLYRDQNTCFRKFKQLLFLKITILYCFLTIYFKNSVISQKSTHGGKESVFLFYFPTVKNGCGLLCGSHQIPSDALL